MTKDKIIEAISIMFGALIVLLIIISPIVMIYGNAKTYEVAEVIVFQDNIKTLYKCTTIDGNEIILSNDDALFLGKFNSSDFAVKMKEAEKDGLHLIIETRGFRVPFCSMYPNIVDIKVRE